MMSREGASGEGMSGGVPDPYLLAAVAAAVSRVGGTEVLGTVCLELARIFQVREAFVAELLPGSEPPLLVTRAHAVGGTDAGATTYPVAGTPCQPVVEEGLVHQVPRGAWRGYPADRHLVEGRLEGYAGAPLQDARGKVIGVVGLMHQAADGFPPGTDTLLRIVAARLGAELGRERAERRLREVESTLHQTRKMEAIGRLAGGIAHDFNNLLTVIRGAAELALMELDDRESVESALHEISASGTRAAALTRQLLAFSRKQVLEEVEVAMGEVLKGMATLLERLMGSEVVVRLEVAQELPLVRADPGQIEQVILNLAVNARDAMPRGGSLHLAARPWTDHPSLPPGVEIRVSDTGTGIPAEVLPYIFEPFFTTKPQGEGTGLGLSTAWGIVRQARGTLEASSEPGKGTTFVLRLPGLPPDGEAPGADTGPTSGESRRLHDGDAPRVLLVEDDPDVRAATEILLQAHGFQVTAFPEPGDLAQGLGQAGGPFDAVVSDRPFPTALPMVHLSPFGREGGSAPGLSGEVRSAPPPRDRPPGPEGLVQRLREALWIGLPGTSPVRPHQDPS